jgi:hypothetical protein
VNKVVVAVAVVASLFEKKAEIACGIKGARLK